MSGFLAARVDPGMSVNLSQTKEELLQEEIARLAKLYAVASAALQIPRRLGADAGKEDLARDKQLARRIQHVASQLVKAWSGKDKMPAVSADVSREAAQVNWDKWWADHSVWLINRARYLATWCDKTGGDEKWTKSAIVKIDNETRWLQYAMR